MFLHKIWVTRSNWIKLILKCAQAFQSFNLGYCFCRTQLFGRYTYRIKVNKGKIFESNLLFGVLNIESINFFQITSLVICEQFWSKCF